MRRYPSAVQVFEMRVQSTEKDVMACTILLVSSQNMYPDYEWRRRHGLLGYAKGLSTFEENG